MSVHDSKEKLRQNLRNYFADSDERFTTTWDEENDSAQLKLKVAIGFAVVCAVLLLGVFILLLYKVIWFRFRNATEQQDKRKLLPLSPTTRDAVFSPSHPQRRHRPLMKTDSSASEVQFGDSNSRRSPSPSSDSENSVESSLKLGKLEFSINYDTETEQLQVTLNSAYDLPEEKATNYIEVYFLPDKAEKRQSSVHYSEPNPVYNECFDFPVANSQLSERTLQFCVFNIDAYSRHHALGEVLHSFDVNDNFQEDTIVTICKEIKRDVFLSMDESPVRGGEVLVSLCYLPTTGRLTFVVLKARLSKVKLANNLPNPYVKVSLMLGGRQIKKTKTSIQKRTMNPVYNEAFVFDVPLHRLSDVSLLVRVLNCPEQDEDEEVGKCIGKAIVGPDARTSIGLHHWNCMMTTPRKPIAQWHPLLG